MISRFGLWTVAVVLAGAALSAGTALYMSVPTKYRVAVGPDQSEDAKILHALAQQLRRDRATVRLDVRTLPSMEAAKAAFEARQVDIAVMRSDFAPPRDAHAIVIMRKAAALLVVPGGSDIEKVGQLAGKKIGLLKQRADNTPLLLTALRASGVSDTEVTPVLLAATDITAAFKEGRIDAIFLVGVPTGPIVSEAVTAVWQVAEKAPDFVEIEDAAALAAREPAYKSLEIVRGLFGGIPPQPTEAFNTVAITYRLMARSTLDEVGIGELTKLIFQMRARIAETVPSATQLAAPDTEKDARQPVHIGAAAYLDGEQKTFFERYGDFFYIGVMAISLIGSGLAAAATRLKQNQHDDLRIVLDRLIALTRTARTVTVPADLDAMEAEIDTLVEQAADQAMDGQIGARRLTALGVLAQQARGAIVERRRDLPREAVAARAEAPRMETGPGPDPVSDASGTARLHPAA